jgi:hypothetical protein
MIIEPLKELLSFYKIKKDTLLYYFDNCISSQIENLNYEGDDYDLFLNDTIYCIHKSKLTLDHIGKIIRIKKNKVSIKEKYTYSVHLNKDDYYIFIKRKSSGKCDYYTALGELLDSLS